MNRENQNLVELWHRHKAQGCAGEALDEMRAQSRGKGGWDLQELLRYHGNGGVHDADEVSMRDAFDDLLAFYSCVEIAAMIRFIPTPLPQEFGVEARGVLANRDVRRYYRKHYPLLLPDLLLCRLNGEVQLEERQSEKVIGLLFDFLNINSLIENDSEVDMLLWFFDDGSHNGYSWKDTLAILRNPNKFVSVLTSLQRRRNPAERSVDGLRKFLAFCVALESLLERSKSLPLLQSALWHYHGYWFRIIKGRLREAVEGALEEFERWLLSPSARALSEKDIKELQQDAEESLHRVRLSVRRLTSGRYSQELRRHMHRQ
jgi:hypothetical protein